MIKQLIKSKSASVTVEFVLILSLIYIPIYFMTLIFGTGYVYSGYIQEKTRNLADYIASSDGWEIILNNNDSLEDMINNYNTLIKNLPVQNMYKNTNLYSNIKINYRIYLIYINKNQYNICAKITYPVGKTSGSFPVSDPVLDSATLSVNGAAWIVQSAMTFRGVEMNRTAVRRPTTLITTMTINGVPYTCKATTTTVTYP